MQGNTTDGGREDGDNGGEDAESCVFKADLSISIVVDSVSV